MTIHLRKLVKTVLHEIKKRLRLGTQPTCVYRIKEIHKFSEMTSPENGDHRARPKTHTNKNDLPSGKLTYIAMEYLHF